MDDNAKATLREIKRCRERVHHYKAWRNEPSERKKLNRWKRRLKKALAAAEAAGVEVPEDPYAPPPPPPPPPTEEELRAEALKALKVRVLLPWQVGTATHAWAPWGDSGWSAVEIKGLAPKWCRANRVNARTGEVVATSAKVRRSRLLKRDPEQLGKDKPALSPSEVFGVSADPKPVNDNSDEHGRAPFSLWGTSRETAAQRKARYDYNDRLMSERKNNHDPKPDFDLSDLLDDDSAVADW